MLAILDVQISVLAADRSPKLVLLVRHSHKPFFSCSRNPLRGPPNPLLVGKGGLGGPGFPTSWQGHAWFFQMTELVFLVFVVPSTGRWAPPKGLNW